MKPSLLLLALSPVFFIGCTTAYKTGQTPDDVYYSAAKPQQDELRSDRDDDNTYRYDDNYYDDRYLRMKVHSRYRWSDLDDWYYYDKYSVGYNFYYGTYYNPYNSWNYFYNPYCCCHQTGYYYYNPKTTVAAPMVRTRYFSLAGYTNNSYNNQNNGGLIKSPNRTTTIPAYNNNNGLSNTLKTIFSNDNSGSRSSRTYTPSSGSSGNSNSSSSSSGSSGKSGSGSVSRPVRN